MRSVRSDGAAEVPHPFAVVGRALRGLQNGDGASPDGSSDPRCGGVGRGRRRRFCARLACRLAAARLRHCVPLRFSLPCLQSSLFEHMSLTGDLPLMTGCRTTRPCLSRGTRTRTCALSEVHLGCVVEGFCLSTLSPTSWRMCKLEGAKSSHFCTLLGNSLCVSRSATHATRPPQKRFGCIAVQLICLISVRTAGRTPRTWSIPP